MKLLSAVLILASIAKCVAGADSGNGNIPVTNGEWKVTMPDPDPLYVQWEKIWQETRSVETDISRLRHEIAFLQIMRELDFSRDQLQAVLPIARQARVDARFALNNVVKYMGRRHEATIRFWRDIMVEDLTPRKKTQTISGNFDKKTWDEGEMGHNYCAPDREWSPDFDLKRQAVAFEALLTPEQRQKAKPDNPAIGGQLRLLRGGSSLGAGNNGHRYRMVLPYWMINVFEETEVLGSWKKTLPDAAVRNPDARPILTGVLLEPHALNWIERQLGLPATGNDWPGEEALTKQAAVLLRYTRRSHYRQIVNANWTKGMRLNQPQTKQMLDLARQMCELYLAEAQDYVAKGRQLTAVLTQMRDLVAAGKDIPPELSRTDAELGPLVGGSYAGGPACEYAAAEDLTFKPRTTAIWKMFPEKTAGLVARAESVLMDTQRIVLWNAHGNCYKPWAVFVSPVLVGGTPVLKREPAQLTQWRQAEADQLPALREKLFADYSKLIQTKKAAQTNAMAQADFFAWLDHVGAMTDSDYQLEKYDLGAVLTGDANCYTGDTSGVGSPEQNGIWPKVDWNDPRQWGGYTTRGKLEARLEFMLMPDNMEFLHVRNELMKQFKIESAADLTKLSLGAPAK